MFRDAAKNPQPMVLTDTARKMTLIGGYGEYDDSLRRSIFHRLSVVDGVFPERHSFLRADTILTSVRVEYVARQSCQSFERGDESTSAGLYIRFWKLQTR